MTRPDVTLVEYHTAYLPAEALTFAEGLALWRNFDQRGKRLHLSFPSPKTENQWAITPQGWVGHIPVAADMTLHIQPRLPLTNLFPLWAYAYNLPQEDLDDDLVGVQSLAAFYEQVVQRLLARVQRRQRQGLYRTYQAHTAVTPFVRGRMVAYPQPPQVELRCHYEEHTADIPENQLIAYTLQQVARSRHCSNGVQTAVRRTAHHLQANVTPRLFTPSEWAGWSYTRLNQDYRPMHALCRFLLEQSTPLVEAGPFAGPPFLLNMARLFELFVAAWLQAHLPAPWRLKVQEVVTVGQANDLRFDIDLVLYDGDGRVTAVLDTKYKTPAHTAMTDVNQVVTYAQAKGAPQAVLVYPVDLVRPLDVQLHHLHVRSLTFAITDDLEQAGQRFLSALFNRLPITDNRLPGDPP
ncbi:MAG: McrC family protein [Anaerolineae bacterium]|nr:McrC family protein [Anaerolineae bacterium]